MLVRRLAAAAVAPTLFTVPAPAPPADVVTPARLMSQVVTMTNQMRHANGCGLLTVSRDLTVASARQSDYMATTGLFTHVWRDGTTFVARAHDAGYRRPSGENIAWGYPSASAVLAAWMASPHHRRNILNCGAHSIGAGVTYAANGVPYYTEVFGWD